jgi:aminoglycoside phosphotransferase (APT) family kinase protein
MNLYPDMSHVEALAKQIFPAHPVHIQRMTEGASTFVYQLVYPDETFYLRILPEEDASFAPELAVHTRLRQMQVKVPEVIYFEHYHERLHRSVMVTTEIKGHPLSQSDSLSSKELSAILVEAGRDLAQINSIALDGFGWVRRDGEDTTLLRAVSSSYRDVMLESWDADLAYLSKDILSPSEMIALEQILSSYEAWLMIEQGYLAHGDFDASHIYQQDGRYTGIIDFGEIRSTCRWYDLAHFHMRDGEALPQWILPALIQGYAERIALPANSEEHIRFISIVMNVWALARSLQKRPANRYTQHQLGVLREDIAVLQQLL